MSLDLLNSQLCTAEEKNSEFSNIEIETIQNKEQREKNMKKNDQNISILWDHMIIAIWKEEKTNFFFFFAE